MSEVVQTAGVAFEAPGAEKILPPLREDLDLYHGPRNQDGSPTWTLHDPARNLFFRIGWLEFEILSRWDIRNPGALLQRVNSETTLHVKQEQLDELTQFLVKNQLIEIRGSQAIQHLSRLAQASKKRFTSWLLHNYLFFRIPLVRPQAFLRASYPFIRFVYTRSFAYTLLACLVLGLYLVARQWDAFQQTFLYLFTLEGLILFGCAVFFAKIIHELGHAYTAYRYGVRIPTMGLAFLVLWPVLYTDTSEAWKLPSRRQRLAIAAAGMAAELSLAILATLLWSFLPDGPLRSAVFMIASTTWVVTLLINANPFMRFDGYYLLSDLMEIQNLHDRSFTLGKWKLRYWLFGLVEPCPETVSPPTRSFMIALAYSVWIYRFFLFLGIALLVYFLFFKVAGIILLFAELGWFIGRPVYREVSEWFKMRDRFTWNRHSLTTALVSLGLIGLLVFPWNVHIYLPALMKSSVHTNIYAPFPSIIEVVAVQAGDEVQQGQLLFTLASPELEFRMEQARHRIEVMRQQLNRGVAHSDFLEHGLVLEEQLARLLAEHQGYKSQQEQLRIRAAHQGRIRDMADALQPGRWINEELLLARIVQHDKPYIEAYITEEKLGRVENGARGRFYPLNTDLNPVPVRVSRIDPSNTRVLEYPYLTSVYGGPIGVEQGQQGELITRDSIYRMHLSLDETGDASVHQVTTGSLRLTAAAQSILYRLWQKTGGVLIRESGF